MPISCFIRFQQIYECRAVVSSRVDIRQRSTMKEGSYDILFRLTHIYASNLTTYIISECFSSIEIQLNAVFYHVENLPRALIGNIITNLLVSGIFSFGSLNCAVLLRPSTGHAPGKTDFCRQDRRVT